MAVRPELSLNVPTFELPNPLAQMAQVTQIQNALQQQRMGDIQMQNALREQRRKGEFERILSGFGPEAKVTDISPALVRGGFLTEARTLMQSEAQLEETRRKAQEAEYKGMISKADLVDRVYGAANDQASHDFAVRRLVNQGIWTPDDVAFVGKDYDPERQKLVLNMTRTGQQRLEADLKKRDTAAREMTAQAARTRAMTDADKFAWERDNPGFEIKETESGLVSVNKRTGQVAPLMLGGAQPPAGAAPAGAAPAGAAPAGAAPAGAAPAGAAPAGAAPAGAAPAGAVSGATPTGQLQPKQPKTELERLQLLRRRLPKGSAERQEVDDIIAAKQRGFGEDVEVKARKESYVRDETRVADAAAAARRTLTNIESAQDSLRRGLDTGFTAETKAKGAAILAAFGLKDAEKYAENAEKFQQAITERVLAAQTEQKGVQTDQDAMRIGQAGARFSNTKAANEFILDVARAVAEKSIAHEKFYDDWLRDPKNNNSLRGAKEAWLAKEGNKSIFESPRLRKYGVLESERMQTTPAPQGPVVGGRSATPRGAAPAGERAFRTVQEAEAANLPSGTRITINGRPAIVE